MKLSRHLKTQKKPRFAEAFFVRIAVSLIQNWYLEGHASTAIALAFLIR